MLRFLTQIAAGLGLAARAALPALIDALGDRSEGVRQITIPAVAAFGPEAHAALPAFVDLLVDTGLAKSKGEARRTIGEGGAYLNNVRVEDPELVPGADDLLGGSWLVLRRGKKNFAGVEVA